MKSDAQKLFIQKARGKKFHSCRNCSGRKKCADHQRYVLELPDCVQHDPVAMQKIQDIVGGVCEKWGR